MTMRRGAIATDRLTKALLDLAAEGLRIHCSDHSISHLWLSENDADRAMAVKLCHGCPITLECWSAAAAQGERWGVWGGVDFTRKPNRLGRPRKIAAA